MQARYLGDSHDFLKYVLLRRAAAECGFKIGLNWYLTNPEDLGEAGNSDGEKRHHLKGGVWENWDGTLLNCLKSFSDPNNRSIAKLETSGVLPEGSRFFGEHVPLVERIEWHERAFKTLSYSDFVFLDPDNGFEVPSASRPKLRKYAMYSEAADYFLRGKSVCSIQFARQCDPVKRALDVREALCRSAGVPASFPILRGRVAPNILFVFLVQNHHRAALLQMLYAMCGDSGGKAELVG